MNFRLKSCDRCLQYRILHDPVLYDRRITLVEISRETLVFYPESTDIEMSAANVQMFDHFVKGLQMIMSMMATHDAYFKITA